jgi:hypothetical protein
VIDDIAMEVANLDAITDGKKVSARPEQISAEIQPQLL